MNLIPLPEPSHGVPGRCGVLPPVIRQQLADLNRQYIELGLEPGMEQDPRFSWSPAVRRRLGELEPGERVRAAATPFALFRLDPTGAADGIRPGVQEGPCTAPSTAHAARLLSFAHQAAFLAGSLAASVPLASSLLLGVTAPAQAMLRTALPSQLAQIAQSQSLIRARWPAHETFWALLAGAAQRGSAAGLEWAYCIGSCLVGRVERESDAACEPRSRGSVR